MKKTNDKKPKTLEETALYKRKLKAIRIIIAIILVSAVVSILIYIAFKQIFDVSNESASLPLRQLVQNHPIIGGIVFVVADIAQVVIAFIPGELLEQAAGYFFNVHIATLLCVIGNNVGSILVLLIVKRFGRNLVYAIYPREKIESASFLRHGKKRDILTFLLYLIPGTPKDILTYVIGLTDMSIPRYLLLTGFTRIPSIVMSTVSGSWIADMAGGEAVLKKLLLWNGAAVFVCAAGYVIYILISRHHSNKSKAHSSENRHIDSDTEKQDNTD